MLQIQRQQAQIFKLQHANKHQFQQHQQQREFSNSVMNERRQEQHHQLQQAMQQQRLTEKQNVGRMKSEKLLNSDCVKAVLTSKFYSLSSVFSKPHIPSNEMMTLWQKYRVGELFVLLDKEELTGEQVCKNIKAVGEFLLSNGVDEGLFQNCVQFVLPAMMLKQ